MGSVNQLSIVKKHKERFSAPYLEVGSKAYEGDVPRVSQIFDGSDFTGVDMLEGDNVDLVLDLTLPFDEIDRQLNGKRFNSIFCLSVLEHCANPHSMAQNLSNILCPGGLIYISVPFSWKFHGYPSDYWRFTPEGIKVLFPDIDFSSDTSWISSDVDDDIRVLKDRDLGRFKVSSSWQRKNSGVLRGISAGILRGIGGLGPLRWLTRHRYLMPPIMIDMVGRKQ